MIEEKPTNHRCKICSGMIVERLEEYEVPSSPGNRITPQPITGGMMRKHYGYHCSGCGIEYHKLPGVGR